MRKHLKLSVLSLVASAFLVGCGSDDSSTTETPKGGNTTATTEQQHGRNSTEATERQGGGTPPVAMTETEATETKTGYFIDAPVAGLSYTTSSGITGVTDSKGRFQYKEGEKVEFRIGKLKIGEAEPTQDGLISPRELTDDEELVILILRTLQALDVDNNPSNGITIPSSVLSNLENIDKEITLSNLEDESKILDISIDLSEFIDEDYDGVIDVNATEALTHYENNLEHWNNGERPSDIKTTDEHEELSTDEKDIDEHEDVTLDAEDATEHGNRPTDEQNEAEHGNRPTDEQNETEHGNRPTDEQNATEHGNRPTDEQNEAEHGNRPTDEQNSTKHEEKEPFNLSDYPDSNLTQDLIDSLAYMGNEERLAYDIYTVLYNYHNESGTEIKQLANIPKSEEKHVGIVQDMIQKYNIDTNNLTDVVNPVADKNVAFEDMPTGVYDIQAIQELYDALYSKGIASQQSALEVGCMVEVTDVNDLDHYIEQAEASNATDIVEGFNVLRDGSYNHYWAFDKGLKNMGVTQGCAVLGEEWAKTADEYPNSHDESEDEGSESENSGKGKGNGGGNQGGRGK